MLEETGRQQPVGAPADTAKDLFNPGAPQNLATKKVRGNAVADSAVSSNSGAGSIAGAASNPVEVAAIGGAILEATGADPILETGAIAPESVGPTPMSVVLPGELEVDRVLGTKGLANLIKKQRGKPGIETMIRLVNSRASPTKLLRTGSSSRRWVPTFEVEARGRCRESSSVNCKRQATTSTSCTPRNWMPHRCSRRVSRSPRRFHRSPLPSVPTTIRKDEHDAASRYRF